MSRLVQRFWWVATGVYIYPLIRAAAYKTLIYCPSPRASAVEVVGCLAVVFLLYCGSARTLTVGKRSEYTFRYM